LAECLALKGPRTVVFRVSGVIDGPLELREGDITIAGHTAPGGITIRGGLVCDNVYDANHCNNLVVRHVRFRHGDPDAVRLGGVRDAVFDHVSLSGAEDENLEITRSQRITVQHSVIAEPRGDHYKFGGVLINYSKDVLPLGDISLHHNVWNGVAGRLPEISCEENADGPGKSNCAGRTLRVDLVNNVAFDAVDPIWFNRCVETNQGNDCAVGPGNVLLDLVLEGNVLARRKGSDEDAPLIEPHLWSGKNSVRAKDNLLLLGDTPAKEVPRVLLTSSRSTGIVGTPVPELIPLLQRRAGAFPRDGRDVRLAAYLGKPVDQRPLAWKNGMGVETSDSPPAGPAPAPPPDRDQDGMPDAWEQAHGLNPNANDSASLELGKRPDNGVIGCTSGYTAIECYLNELAEERVK